MNYTLCVKCKVRPGVFQCARCKSVSARYCSRECQKEAWSEHKPNCGAKRIRLDTQPVPVPQPPPPPISRQPTSASHLPDTIRGIPLKYIAPEDPKENKGLETVFLVLHGIGDNPGRVLDQLKNTELSKRGMLVGLGGPVKTPAHQQNTVWYRQAERDCTRVAREDVGHSIGNVVKMTSLVHNVIRMLEERGYACQNMVLWGIGQGAPIAFQAANTYSKPIGAAIAFESGPLVNRTNMRQLGGLRWNRQCPLFVRLGALSRRTTPKELSRQLEMMRRVYHGEGIVRYFVNPLAVDCYDLMPEDVPHLDEFLKLLLS